MTLGPCALLCASLLGGLSIGTAAAQDQPAQDQPTESPPAATAAPAPAPAPALTAATATRSARLQGSVRFERNRPVIGAAVAVFPESGSGEVVATTTDSRGTFRLDGVPDGLYTVVFERTGLETVRKEHVELKAPFRPTVEVTMRSGPSLAQPVAASESEAALRGLAADRDGSLVSDLKVRLLPVKGDADPVEQVSNSRGEFVAAGIASGPWVLEARGLAYLPVRVTLPLSGGEMRLRLVLVSQPAAYDPIPIDLLPPEEPIPPPDPAQAQGSGGR